MNQPRVYAALLFMTLLWGVSFVGTKIALRTFTPFSLIFFRFFIASLFFLTLFLFKGFPRLTRPQHLRLALLSLFEPILYFLFETYGLLYTTASEASLIIALIPVFVLLLSHLVLKEEITGRAKLGISLSVGGILLLIVGGDTAAGIKNLWGNLLILGAVLSAALYTLLSRKLSREVSVVSITGFQFFYGALFFFPLSHLTPPLSSSLTTQSLGALLFLAFGATVGAFLCYNYALSKVKAATASVFINGIPVVTAITGWIVLDERLQALQIIGAAIVVLGVTLTSGKKQTIAIQTPLA